MKIWEAIQMLQQMDQTKECTVSFDGAKVAIPFDSYQKHPHVIGREQWVNQINVGKSDINCNTK